MIPCRMPPSSKKLLAPDAVKKPYELGAKERKRLREKVVERDGATCRRCGCDLSDGDEPPTLEHVLPQVLGGPHALWNLVLFCEPCNFTHDYQGIANARAPKAALIIAGSMRALDLGSFREINEHVPVRADGFAYDLDEEAFDWTTYPDYEFDEAWMWGQPDYVEVDG